MIEPVTVEITRSMVEDCQDRKVLIYHLFEEAGVPLDRLESGRISEEYSAVNCSTIYTWVAA